MRSYASLVRRLWKLLAPFHIHFFLQLGGTIATQAIQTAEVFLMAQALNSIIAKDPAMAFLFAGATLGLALVRISGTYLTDRHAQNNLDYAIQQYLEEYSFRKIFKLNISQYIEDHSAVKEQVISRGESAVETVISTLILTILPMVTQVLFALAAIAYFSPVVALWTFIALVIVVLWENHFSQSQRPLVKENREHWDEQKKVRTESFQHLSLIRTLGAEGNYLRAYLAHRLGFVGFQEAMSNRGLSHGTIRSGFTMAARMVSMFIIIYLAAIGAVSAGAIYAVWSYLNQAYSQIYSMVRTVRQLPLRLDEVEKYLDIVDLEPAFDESGEKPALAGDIALSHLTFAYPHGTGDALSDVSVVIPHGKTTAFVGSSGSGKTTIVRLLLRHYQYAHGSIAIAGHELRAIDAAYLRERIGYVEQHVDLFDDTVRKNILIGVPEDKRTEAERRIEPVAAQARISEFYHRLGDAKFETVIGERGVKLSGGERQRIGIARAIIRDPEILIFDEATSALDAENEAKVMEAIENVSRGRTSIVIAHRLSTVRDADKIVVMDRGRILGEGTHEELLRENAFYRNLVAHQV